MKQSRLLIQFILITVLISGCSGLTGPETLNNEDEIVTDVLTTETPFQSNKTDQEDISIWIDLSVPIALSSEMKLGSNYSVVDEKIDADYIFGPVNDQEDSIEWVYLLAAPFPTLMDSVSYDDLLNAWHGDLSHLDDYLPILLSSSTSELLTSMWGTPDEKNIKITEAGNSLDAAWQGNNLAIIPFEQLVPQWKLIKINGLSPLDKSNNNQEYPLLGKFGFQINSDNASNGSNNIIEDLSLPLTNLDKDRLTIIVMTGVTALVRSTALRMEEKGMTYPAEKIRDWLLDADLTHISNEVSFDPNCPPANPYQDSLQFCSRPEYIDLFDYIDVDIIELTGNHLMNWNRSAFEYSLDLYKQHGWYYYGGGINAAEAAQSLLIEHNSNKFAFIGCNPAGPEYGWATDTSPGNIDCDYDEIASTIKELSEEGYLPIFTIQFYESYTSSPNPAQIRVFRQMSEAGAVIVSGSQAHFPQIMEFQQENFIHYGLGNLFFDQMDLPVPGTRREFIDRHYFYDGKYINTELLTAMLEDYAQPRPMSVEERNEFLDEIFSLGNW